MTKHVDQKRLADRRFADLRASTMDGGPLVARVDAALDALEIAADRALLAAVERDVRRAEERRAR